MSAPAGRPPNDPTAAVEQAFGRIHEERMAGLPILNPVLRVQAVDFQPWQTGWLGVVVTPWCMSVLLLSDDPARRRAAPGAKRLFVKFPFGELALLESNEPELGTYGTCALFSPMDKFATQAQALATAHASMTALLTVPAATPPPSRGRPAASRRRFLGLRQTSQA